MIDWLEDMAANLVADLLLVAAGVGIGLGFLGRLTDRYVTSRVYTRMETEVIEEDETSIAVRVANLSSEPIYRVNVIISFDLVGEPFDAPPVLALLDRDLAAGETAYGGGGQDTPRHRLSSIDVDFETIRGVIHRRVLYPKKKRRNLRRRMMGR